MAGRPQTVFRLRKKMIAAYGWQATNSVWT